MARMTTLIRLIRKTRLSRTRRGVSRIKTSLSPNKLHLFSLALILQFFTIAWAQDIEVRIKIKPGAADVRARFISAPPASLSFLDIYGQESGLLSRMSHVYFYDKQQYLIARKRITASDRVSTANIGGFAYTIDLKPRQGNFAAAHLSWLSEAEGILMLDDLLPAFKGKSVGVLVELPAGWKLATSAPEVATGVFLVPDPEKAVFYLGKDLRIAERGAVTTVITGEWLFKDDEAVKMVDEIAGEYSKLFGPLARGRSVVRIGKFPSETAMSQWEADARGSSVTILSSDMPFKNQSLQRLHEQLRHELFHLWVPNRLNLTGKYDWFYEGFALYQSLKTGVAKNQIRFGDYLDTLSRALAIDNAGENRSSLIELSNTRWTGENTRVYARGMLTAFACDLAMLRESKGKRSVTDLIVAIVKKYSHPAPAADANTAILGELRSRPELVPFVDSLITGNDRFEFTPLLKDAGLEVVQTGSNSSIRAVVRPNGKQKDMLKRLGSENWRNIR